MYQSDRLNQPIRSILYFPFEVVFLAALGYIRKSAGLGNKSCQRLFFPTKSIRPTALCSALIPPHVQYKNWLSKGSEKQYDNFLSSIHNNNKKRGKQEFPSFFYDKLFIFSGTCWRGANSTVEKRVHCLVKTWTTPLFERVIHPDLEQNEVDSTKCPCSSKCFSLDAGQVFKCDDGADECNSLIAPRNERTHITHGSAIPFFIGERQCVTCFG